MEILLFIYAISMILSISILFIGLKYKEKLGLNLDINDKILVFVVSFLPIVNTIFFLWILFILSLLKKEKHKKELKELEVINQPLECLACAVYTRKGYIDIFNIDNEEPKCPNCEQPLNVRNITISDNHDLPFAEKFTLADFENIKQNADKKIQANLIKEQNEKYLKAREIKVRQNKEGNEIINK